MRRKPSAAFSLTEIMLASLVFLLALGIVAAGMWAQNKSFQATQERNRLKEQAFSVIDSVSSDLRAAALPIKYYDPSPNPGSPCGTLVGYGYSGRPVIQFLNSTNHLITYQLALSQGDPTGNFQKVVAQSDGSAPQVYNLADDLYTFALVSQDPDPLKCRIWEIQVLAQKGDYQFPADGNPMTTKAAVRVGEYVAGIPERISSSTIGSGPGPGPSTIAPSTTTSIRPTTSVRRTTTSVRRTTTSVRRTTTSVRRTTTSVRRTTTTVYDPPPMRSVITIYKKYYGNRGGCWWASEELYKDLKNAGYGVRIIHTSSGSNHRQIEVFVNGSWRMFAYDHYGFNRTYRVTSYRIVSVIKTYLPSEARNMSGWKSMTHNGKREYYR